MENKELQKKAELIYKECVHKALDQVLLGRQSETAKCWQEAGFYYSTAIDWYLKAIQTCKIHNLNKDLLEDAQVSYKRAKSAYYRALDAHCSRFL